jgi:hypothetical protein
MFDEGGAGTTICAWPWRLIVSSQRMAGSAHLRQSGLDYSQTAPSEQALEGPQDRGPVLWWYLPDDVFKIPKVKQGWRRRAD